MNWDTIQEQIYYWDGSLRDIYVLDTTRELWRQYVELINAGYAVSFYNGQTGETGIQIDFDVICKYWEGHPECNSTATITIRQFTIKCHFFIGSEIENDILPTEFTSMEDHLALLNYLQDVATALTKRVVLTAENRQENVLLAVDGSGVHYL